MLLVDEQIRLLCNAGKLIIKGFNPENIQSISYDLRIQCILLNNVSFESGNEKNSTKEVHQYVLRPGETVYIEADIILELPVNIAGIIADRNSVMRTGLEVTGPCYQPGHKTKVFLRVHNISSTEIKIQKNMSIAQIMFVYLNMKPSKPYNKSYQNEFRYSGVKGDLEMDWCSQLERYNDKILELKNTENRIYGNILSLMGILVSILALIIFNFGTLSSGQYTIENIVCANFSICLIITFLIGTITLILNKRNKSSYFGFAILLFILIIVNIFAWNKLYTNKTPSTSSTFTELNISTKTNSGQKKQ